MKKGRVTIREWVRDVRIPLHAQAGMHEQWELTITRHNTNMAPDDIMERVSNGVINVGWNPGWKALETAGNVVQGEETQGSHKTDKPRDCKHLPAKHAVSVKGGRGDLNLSLCEISKQKTGVAETGGGTCGGESDKSGLNEIIEAWPSLSPGQQAAALAVIRSVPSGQTNGGKFNG